MSTVTIHYTRVPDRLTVFRQRLVAREGPCTITLMDETPLRAPVLAGGDVVLEDGAPVVWFTFERAWHDIGAFHLRDGTFTGWYANIITPVVFGSPTEWETTDLLLDVWLGADGVVRLLDEDEFAAAVRGGLVDAAVAARARQEANALMSAAADGAWPGAEERAWTLARARGTLDTSPV